MQLADIFRVRSKRTALLQVDKAQATFYEIVISQSDIAQGFIVGAYSTAGHRIKLLLFEPAGRQSWELQEQVRHKAYPSCSQTRDFIFRNLSLRLFLPVVVMVKKSKTLYA